LERNRSETRLLLFDHYHGAMCRVAQSETAFPVREPGFGYLVQAEWRDSADASDQRGWVDQTSAALAPFAAEIAYSANLGDEGSDGVRRCYGPNYPRLSAIKRKYDPDNLFRMNQNILPAAQTR
jgi:FAD/FMN-containing dehydrogenase